MIALLKQQAIEEDKDTEEDNRLSPIGKTKYSLLY